MTHSGNSVQWRNPKISIIKTQERLMTIPDRVRSVVMPPIDALNSRMAELLAQGCDCLLYTSDAADE